MRNENASSRRIKRVVESGLEGVELLMRQLEADFGTMSDGGHSKESNSLVSKRAKLLVKYIQLLYQDVYGHVTEFWEHQASE